MVAKLHLNPLPRRGLVVISKPTTLQILFSAAEDGRHYARAAPRVKDGEHEQRFLVRGVGDEVNAHNLKP
jgi:hypothetical protein